MSCVWEKGRQLKSISDGANTVSFTYDEFGMRTTKTAGGITTNYVYENGKLLREVTGSEKIDFVYGSDGIIGFRTGNKNYLYRKNVFGDVTEIYSDNGTLVGKYSYTAFGECIVKVNEGGIAEKNPIRYRGYYYDEEMSLYYLKSRYYDPVTGRFITIDDISYIDPETINGLNLYAYCGNNPVMRVDSNGTSWWTDFWNGVGNWFKDNWVKLVIGAVFIVAGAAVTFFTAGMGTAGLLAAGSALLASAKAVGISMAVSAGIGAVVGGITGGWEGAIQGFSNGLADGFMWGGIFAGSAQILGGASKLLAGRNVDFSDKFNLLFGNRNSQSTTLLRVNRAGKQLFRIDASVKELWHLHYGATSALMRIHRTGIALFSYLVIANGLKGLFGGF